jgi:uncharacterized membrane protein YebE (DUF533 family)
MKRIAHTISLLTLLALLITSATACAEENAFQETFKDAVYGGAVGTLVGLALTAFAKRPADHMDNLAYGAAGGILAGTAYGVTKSARALAELNNGKVRIAVPRIMPDVAESQSTHQTVVTWRADILRGTFY